MVINIREHLFYRDQTLNRLPTKQVLSTVRPCTIYHLFIVISSHVFEQHECTSR